MSNYKGSIQSRVGRPFRVEYVNRAGEQVNPRTGKPISKPKFVNKPYARSMSKENGLTTAKNRKLPIKRTGSLFGPIMPIKTDPTVDPPPHVCFNCWQPGHKKTKCPRPMITRFCKNCGRRNEDMSTCPRCKDAYKIWQETIQNRGDDINEQVFMVDDDDENDEIAEVNDPDEILQELIYQDQKTREQLEYQQKKQALNAIYKSNILKEHGAFTDNRDGYADDSYYQIGWSVVPKRDPYVTTKESNSKHFVDPLIDGDLYTNKHESYHNLRRSSQQERHIGKAVFKEREGYEQDIELEQSAPYQGYNECSYHREERLKTLEQSRINDNWQKAVVDASSVSNSDPVQDILKLAKTISHLSSETQDLIMRQVIAERQEQTRQRGVTQKHQNNLW